jgi:hypothetical protein
VHCHSHAQPSYRRQDTLVWTPVQARVEQEKGAISTQIETGTRIPSRKVLALARRYLVNDDDDKALLFRNIISVKQIVSTLVWTPVQAREEQEKRAKGTETETGTQIPSTMTTGQDPVADSASVGGGQ